MQAPTFESLITPPWPPVDELDESYNPYFGSIEHLHNENSGDDEVKEIEQVAVLGYN